MWKSLSICYNIAAFYVLVLAGDIWDLASQSGSNPHPPALEGKAFTAGLLGQSTNTDLSGIEPGGPTGRVKTAMRWGWTHHASRGTKFCLYLKFWYFSSLLVFFINFDFKNIPLKALCILITEFAMRWMAPSPPSHLAWWPWQRASFKFQTDGGLNASLPLSVRQASYLTSVSSISLFVSRIITLT